jgi:hypothetical protein
MGYIKSYMKAVADKLPEERREKFMAEAPAAVKELLGRFSELQFFTGESMDLEGSMAYAYYKEGASEPTFLYFKDGLKDEDKKDDDKAAPPTTTLPRTDAEKEAVRREEDKHTAA